MEKPKLLKSINDCMEACEALATACSSTEDYDKCSECLGKAIDCADAGMILSMKLSSAPDELHRNLIKQYVSYCKTCVTTCAKYDLFYTRLVLERCKMSIEACENFVREHIHADPYSFTPTSHAHHPLSA